MDHTTGEPERWLAVVGYEGFYEVSDLGRVRSLDRTVPHPFCGTITRRGRLLTLTQTAKGYRIVGLCRNGKAKTPPVHRLVGEAFLGPLPDGMETRHLDGNPANNRASNLTYGTSLENNRDKSLHGTATGRNKLGQLAPSCPNGHPYTPENTRRDSRGDRRCRECIRLSARRYRAKLAAYGLQRLGSLAETP